jgi:chromosome segregation ATPase
MQDITGLEQRITAALERIGKGVDRIAARPQAGQASSPVAPSSTEAALRAQLEEEKALTSQLQDRLRLLKDREAKGDLQAKIDRLTQQLDVKGLELQRMRRTNSALREQLAALQAAKGGDAQATHKAMAAELDALRALRLAEVAEMDDILAALEPHLTAGEARNA